MSFLAALLYGSEYTAKRGKITFFILAIFALTDSPSNCSSTSLQFQVGNKRNKSSVKDDVHTVHQGKYWLNFTNGCLTSNP